VPSGVDTNDVLRPLPDAQVLEATQLLAESRDPLPNVGE
jgi:hypothetical protein